MDMLANASDFRDRAVRTGGGTSLGLTKRSGYSEYVVKIKDLEWYLPKV